MSEGAAPGQALRRIAYLLEAEGERSYKVGAFRRAADTVATIPPDRLTELAEAGRLESLPGVGRVTASVITEAISGVVPSYLEVLEQRAPGPPPGAAGELLAALQGDCHSHSDWSDGGSSVEEMAFAAAAAGRRYQALTDHSPRLTIAHGLSGDDLRRQMALVEELNERLAPFRLLTGIEVDILEDGSLDQQEELLGALDVVVASVHSKLRMDAGPMTRRMIAAVENPLVDILGHCTGRIVVGRGRPPSSFDHEAVFAACAESDTALEINSRPDRRDPPAELLRCAAAAGCKFSIDTDAHAPGQLAWLRFGCQQAAEAGIGAASVVNALGIDDFLGWTRAHR